jgi:hypothetical protein
MFYRISEGNRVAMGTRQQRERQQGLWIPAAGIRRGGGNPLKELIRKEASPGGRRAGSRKPDDAQSAGRDSDSLGKSRSRARFQTQEPCRERQGAVDRLVRRYQGAVALLATGR